MLDSGYLSRELGHQAGLPAYAVISPEPARADPRELQILGLLIVGQSNAEIAHTLTVAHRTVAAHIEHILHKMDAPTRTLAAVRAEREGLYVPFLPSVRLRPLRR
jgi:DNA-binding NarL/FixJ family response regulator